MKKIIGLLLLLIGAATLKGQTNLQLSYDLEVGEQLFYEVKKEELIKKSYVRTYWLEFNVLEKQGGAYSMSMTFRRIYERLRNSIYDSNQFYHGTDFSFGHKYDQLSIDQPVYFKLDADGSISEIRYSEALNEKVRKHVPGIEAKRALKKVSLLSEDNLRITLRAVFAKLPSSPRAAKWSETIAATEVSPELEMNYSRGLNTSGALAIKATQQFTNEDSLVINEGGLVEVYPERLTLEGEYYLDLDKRLTDSSTTLSNSKILRSHGTIGTLKTAIEKKAEIKVKRISKISSGKRTVIAGRAPNYATLEDITFSIWYDFPDASRLKLTAKPKNGTFHLPFNLDFSTELYITAKLTSTNVSSYETILIEPGDSLFLDLNRVGFTTYKGKGAAKNQILQQVRALGQGVNPELKPGEVKRRIKRNLKEKNQLIEKNRNKLSEWAYRHLIEDTYFREQQNLHNYYIGSTNRKPDAALFEALFNDLDLSGHPGASSFEFRWFIRDYIKSYAQVIYRNKIEIPIKSQDLYTLSKMLLQGEQEYFASAFYIMEAMKLGKAADYQSIYNDFEATYPNSTLTKLMGQSYRGRGNYALGDVTPDFELRTLEGKPFKLSSLRGKWVMLMFFDLDNAYQVKDLPEISKMSQELSKEEFELVLAFSQSDKAKTDTFLTNHDYRAIYLDNHGWKQKEARAYRSYFRSDNYLLNPEGELEFAGSRSAWDRYIDDFIEYIHADMEERAIGKADSNPPTFLIILVASGVLALIWLYFVIKTARIKRKEKQKLERVEMEIKAVRSQLNPHFLFNAMNSIQHLVNTDQVEKANLSMAKFAGLMRKVLNQSDQQMQSLQQEIETLKDYLELEALRHGFDFSVDIDEVVDIHNTDIPPMLLQPFVENAVIHGISHIKETGKIDIAIGLSGNDSIFIRIIDNGQGLNGQPNPQSNGKGLELTHKRINLFMEKFKNEISFMLKDRAEYDGQRGAFAEIIVGLER